MDSDREQAASELRDGIEIHRYPLRPAASSIGYLREYGQAFWRLRRLVRRLQRAEPFDVVHAANPPDFLLLAARSARAGGARFIFDQHDLMPELFRSRFRTFRPGASGVARDRAPRDAICGRGPCDERVLSPDRNGAQRGAPRRRFVVRNNPDLERLYPVEPDPALRCGRRHLLAYLGRMGRQDGIDHAVRSLAALRDLRSDDWRAVFIGEGEVRSEMEALAAALGLAGAVEFVGWKDDPEIRRILSSADVCLAPEPSSPLNDASTMVKVPEYMAMGCAIASYDLPETRFSAGPAASYVSSSDPRDLGRCVHELLEDDARREEMGRLGRRRAAELSWEQSAETLLAAYERAMAPRAYSGDGSAIRRDPAGIGVG